MEGTIMMLTPQIQTISAAQRSIALHVHKVLGRIKWANKRAAAGYCTTANGSDTENIQTPLS
jgi:hypothetical protein